jgi:hypothetical protein
MRSSIGCMLPAAYDVSGDHIVHELHEMSGMLTDSGEKMSPHQELSIRVMVKEQGKWLIAALYNTIVRPVATPTPGSWMRYVQGRLTIRSSGQQGFALLPLMIR